MAELLIIDDDAQTTQALAALLRERGHAVHSAPDAGSALSCLNRQTPDLILLDLGLPRVGGLELLDALRDEGRFAGIPVAVYTGQDQPDVRAAARKLGARDFIVKGQPWPSTLEQITRCLCPTDQPC